MTLELIFLACGLFGAFSIGLFTAFYASRASHKQSKIQLQELDAKLKESQEALDMSSGRIVELRERIAAGVDPEVYLALRDKYDLLEYEHVELERRVALGLLGQRKEQGDDLRFLEEIGIAITGEVPPQDLDDLTRIQGVSPYLAERLKNIGIRTFDQIARLTDEQVRRVNDAIEILPGRIRREDWVGQCQRVIGAVKKT